jgi:hypothetical protein
MSNCILVLFLSLLLLSSTVHAEGPGDDALLPNEKTKREVGVVLPEIYASEFPGEAVSLQTGELSYTVEDVRIPGPNGMDVVFSRQYKSYGKQAESVNTMGGAWSISIPKITTTRDSSPGSWSNKRPNCTDFDTIEVRSTNNLLGASIGQASMSALATDIPSNSSLLSGNVILSGCDTLITPDGLTISITDKFKHSYRPGYNSSDPTYKVTQSYVSKIEDKFGNFVEYHYEYVDVTTGKGKKLVDVPLLVRISNSEGSFLTISYIDRYSYPKVSKVEYNDKAIRYFYSTIDDEHINLIRVEDELGRATKYDWAWIPIEDSSPTLRLKKTTLHTGATATYDYEFLSPGDPAVCGEYLPCAPCPLFCSKPAVKSHTIEGPGIQPKTISYIRYHKNNDIEVTKTESGANSTKKKRYTFHRASNSLSNSESGAFALNGLLRKEEHFNGTTKLYEKINDWTYVKLGEVACTRFSIESHKHCGQSRLTKETEKHYLIGGVDSYYRSFSSFNIYGQYKKVTESNSFSSATRSSLRAYSHSLKFWELNKPTSFYLSEGNDDYTEISKRTYYSDDSQYKGAAESIYKFGRKTSTITSYHLSGSHRGVPKKISYNSSNRWIELNDYKNGNPQEYVKTGPLTTELQYAYTQYDDDGRIRSYRDFSSKECGSFIYDNAGRVTKITSCGSANTDIRYSDVVDSNFDNIDDGMLKQTITIDNKEVVNFYDGFLRVKLKQERDKLITNSGTFVRTDYDSFNRKVFQSRPDFEASTYFGTTLEYDPLDRITVIKDNTYAGQTEHSFYSGNKVRVSDNLGNTTETSYHAFGYPQYTNPELIESPEEVKTELTYNHFGNITSIKQGGITENRVYDQYQNLCKVIRPDIGNTAYQFNALDEILWHAAGTSISNDTDKCDFTVSSSEKVIYSYDFNGNVKFINYGDSSPDKTLSYDEDGRITKISTSSSKNEYGYLSSGKLDWEKLTIDGEELKLDYSYDNKLSLQSVKYPNGEIIYYSPNAFGVPTGITGSTTYASDIKHDADRRIVSFKYGNGFIHSKALKPNGLPDRIKDTKGNAIAFEYSYLFDANGNMTRQTDELNSLYNYRFTYDDMDRLSIIEDSSAGTGYVSYDELGNISNYKLGNRTLAYHYSTSNELESISGSLNYDFDYDARGNIKNDGKGNQFVYNIAQHTVSVTSSGKKINFGYDGKDKRSIKSIGANKTIFFYGQDGKLYYKINTDGSTSNLIYLRERIVAENKIGGSNSTPEPLSIFSIEGIATELFENQQTSIGKSHNIDSDEYQTMSWTINEGSSVVFEYKIDFGTSGRSSGSADVNWTNYGTFANSGSTSLFYTVGPISSSNIPRTSITTGSDYAKLHLRMKVLNDTSESDWRYIEPIWVYYKS